MMSARQQKVVAIVQARMGSTRLPAKVLSDIRGKPMLERVVERTRAAKTLDEVVVATSRESGDDAIAEYCATRGIACHRGSEKDVLDRYWHAAVEAGADAVVRITSDCPLVDPAVVDKVVQTYLEGDFDYVANNFRYTYPDGLDVEVFSIAALERAWKESHSPVDREHVTPHMRGTRDVRRGEVEHEQDLSRRALRWTVDEPRDLEMVRAVYAHLGDRTFGMEDVLALLAREPQIEEMNMGLVRNEGYYRSFLEEPVIPAKQPDLARSLALRERAARLIPSGTQTFSKGPTQYVQGVAPVYLARGKGCRVWDVDGNEYIDYLMGLGPVILGYGHEAVDEAVIRQARDGASFSLPHPLEVEVAERLTRLIPCAEMVRFGKNGSDVTAGAIRAARAYTGRDMVACAGYHGWQDWYIGTTTRNKGVPAPVAQLTASFRYNDIESLRKLFREHPGRLAAVILEPAGVSEPKDGFLQQVRDLCTKEGAVLVFDEIVTGFRFALGGAQSLYGVTPDLACFGKAMANGYPLSAVVGRRDIMAIFDEVFFSFTFGGEAVSLAAAAATIDELERLNAIAHNWEEGQKLKDGYNVLAKHFSLEHLTSAIGPGLRSVVTWTDEAGEESLQLFSLFQQECVRRGVLFSGVHNVSYAHKEADIEQTLRVYRSALECMAEAIKAGDVAARLDGEPVKPVFRPRR